MKCALVLIATLLALAVPAAAAGVSPLPFHVVDAEFSAELNALVMISTGPNQLHVYYPDTRQLTSIDLPPIAPSSVSVSPDGRTAAVGHDAWVSYVDLTARSVKAIPTSVDVYDVVLAGNGWIYAFPRRDQWCSIVGVEIATGRQVDSSNSIYAGTVARLHPSGTAMYGADRGLMPSDIEK
jgi:hypothetical protein